MFKHTLLHSFFYVLREEILVDTLAKMFLVSISRKRSSCKYVLKLWRGDVKTNCRLHIDPRMLMLTQHWGCNKSSTTGATSGSETALPLWIPEFTSSAHYRSWYLCSSFTFTCLNFLIHVVMSATIFVIGIYLWIMVSNTIPYRLTVIRRVLLVEHGRPEHLCSPGFRVAQVFCVVFCRSLFILFLLTIVLSVLRFTTSDYRYDIIQTDTSILKV